MCACPQIANPQIFMTNLQIADQQTSPNTAQLCLKTVLKVVRRKSMFLQIRKKAWAVKSSKRKSPNYESTNHKKYWLCISFVYLRMFRKAIKLFKFANLRIRDLRNSFADGTPLLNTQR
jgi:hypothetical protein